MVIERINKIKGLLVLFIIIIIVNLSIISAPEYDINNPETWITNSGLIKLIDELEQAPGSTEGNIDKINSLMSSMTEDQRNYIYDRLVKGIYDVKGTVFNYLDPGLGVAIEKGLEAIEKKISEIGSIQGLSKDKVRELAERYLALESYGEEFTKVEKIEGFGSSKLKFKKSKTGIVVGDGSVWLNLGKIPNGVKEIKYDEGQGVFILTLKGGGKIILNKGATNEEGGLTLEGFDVDSLEEIGFIGGKTGEISISKEGIKLKGDAEVKYNGLILSRNPDSSEGFVRTDKDGFYLTGVKAKILNPQGEGFVEMIVGEKEKFLRVQLGPQTTLKDLKSIKDAISDFKNGPVVEKIHFDDGEKQVFDSGAGFGEFGTNTAPIRRSMGDIHFFFDEETGEVTHVRKDEINNGEWIKVGSSMDDDLEKIYDASSDSVQKIIIAAILDKEKVDYDYIRGVRNQDEWLRRGKKIYEDSKVLDGVSMRLDEKGIVTGVRKNSLTWVGIGDENGMEKIRGESSEKVNNYIESIGGASIDMTEFVANTVPPNVRDFMIVAGGNVLLGGDVEVNIRQDLDSLDVYNLHENSNVHVNGIKIGANAQGEMTFQRRPVAEPNDFNVDYVSTTNNGITNAVTYKILDQGGDANAVHSLESERFVAGREVFTGPAGVTVDAYVTMDSKDVQDSRVNEMTDGGDVQDVMDERGFEFKLELGLPVSGSVKFDKAKKDKALEETLLPWLEDVVLNNYLNPVEGQGGLAESFVGDRQAKIETSERISSLIKSAVRDKYNGGELGIGFKHVPNGNPQLVVYEDGKAVNTVELKGKDGELVGDMLEGVRRGPYMAGEKGIRALWGQNIGNKVRANRGFEGWDYVKYLWWGNSRINKYSNKMK